MLRCISYLCTASCCFCLFIRWIAHLDGLFTLSASFLHIIYVFLYVLLCGLALLPASLHISVFSLSFSLPALPPFSVWCVFDWESCQPFLIGLLLHLMLADWPVLLTSGDVMRSWLAASNLCMNSSIDVFCIAFNWWICRLIHLLFPSFIKGCNIIVLYFFLNALRSEIFCCCCCFFLFCVPMVALFVCKTAWRLTRILVFNVFLLQKKRMHQIPSLLINRINLS